jgi:large subunit ribosomal protein L21
VFIFLHPCFSVFQELTRLRIADIQGIEKPKSKVDPKQKMVAVKQQEKVAVAA